MNTVKNLKIDYSFMSGLFDGRNGWKSYYFNEAQACFKKHYGLIGK